MRPPFLIDLAADASAGCFARGQNFTVEAVRGATGDLHSVASTDETIVLCFDASLLIEHEEQETSVGEGSAAIVAPGAWTLRFTGDGRIYILATGRTDRVPDTAVDAARYLPADGRVAPIGSPFRRLAGDTPVVVYRIADLPFPPGNPRLKFLQSATMSINWVEYSGVRDRKSLSPHAHADIEQGSLAIEGHFTHHLRTPWKADADAWQEDLHMAAAPQTLLIVPPEIIHTTEGVGDGRHVLIDIFSPPRRDFIAKGWMHNAADYGQPD